MSAAESTARPVPVTPRWRELVQRVRGSRGFAVTARVGLVGRGIFYLLLAVLVATLLVAAPGQWQANANGVLRAVAGAGSGELALLAAAVGFTAFGLLRIAGALGDRRPGRLRRLTTAGQGLVHLGLAVGTAAFLLGRSAVGSEAERLQAASRILGLPGGQLLLALPGAVVLLVCVWQVVVTVSGGFADTLRLHEASPQVRRFTLLVARVGIPARALAFLPVGVFLLAAAINDSPGQVKGLDGFLLELARASWGRVVVVLVALGLATFGVYSLLEARFRHVGSGA